MEIPFMLRLQVVACSNEAGRGRCVVVEWIYQVTWCYPDRLLLLTSRKIFLISNNRPYARSVDLRSSI